MQGFFICISDNRRKDPSPDYKPKAFVYRVTCSLNDSSQFVSGGEWFPTQMEKHEDHLLIKPSAGYHVKVDALKDNPYFEKFSLSTEISCNGWTEGDKYFPYKVTRYRNDKMFLLLAEGLPTKPVHVRKETLLRVLGDYQIIYK